MVLHQRRIIGKAAVALAAFWHRSAAMAEEAAYRLATPAGVAHRRLATIAVLGIVLALAAAATPASAIEFPQGQSEVRVPLAVGSGVAVAGVELAFTKTEGLVYLRFEAAPDGAGTVGGTARGKDWVGFYATDNRFAPGAGGLAIGSLVFSYAGDAPESITVTDLKLHRVDAQGSVVTAQSAPNTVIPVTRAGGSGGGTGGNNNNNGGGEGTGAGGNGGGTDAGGAGTGNSGGGATVIPGPDGGAASGGTATAGAGGAASDGRSKPVDPFVAAGAVQSADAAAGDGGATRYESDMVPFAPPEASLGAGAESIGDAETPLAPSALDGVGVQGAGALGWFWAHWGIALAAALVAAFAIFLIAWKRRKREE